MSYKLYSTALGRMVDSSGKGDFTTITAATAAAVSGQTIFIKAGTYTEDFSPKDGVTYVAYNATSGNFGVKIVGKLSFSAAATCSFRGIYFQTNSDNIVSITGTGNVILDFNNCYFNASNATAFSCTASAGTQSINFTGCVGDLGTTGITWWVFTRGGVTIRNCNFGNGGISTTTSSFSNSSSISASNSTIQIPITTSDSASVGMTNCTMRLGGGYNLTNLTLNGAGTVDIEFCLLESGTASTIAVGSGVVAEVYECTLDSSNTNTISGTGTLRFGGLTFTSTSRSIQSTLTRTQRQGSYFGAQFPLIESKVASNSATIDFTSQTNLYEAYMLVFQDAQPASAGSVLQLQMSNDGGSSWIATGYQAGCNTNPYNSATLTNSNSTTNWILSGAIRATNGNDTANGELYVHKCNTGSKSWVTGKSSYSDNGTTNATMASFGGSSGSTGTNAFRVKMSSGNIATGTFTLYGVKKTY